MPKYKSNNEFFAAFQDLANRIEWQGNAGAARELRDGYSRLNGLTDGWADLMDAVERTMEANRGKIAKQEMSELRDTFRELRGIVYRGDVLMAAKKAVQPLAAKLNAASRASLDNPPSRPFVHIP
jgi:hypothetical protein